MLSKIMDEIVIWTRVEANTQLLFEAILIPFFPGQAIEIQFPFILVGFRVFLSKYSVNPSSALCLMG